MKLLISLLLCSVAALSAQTHSATISVAPNTTGDPVTTYNVLKGITSGGELSTPIGTIPASSCTATCTFIDLAVIGGQTYYYTITATNNGGTSSPSPELKLTIPFFPPNIPATPTGIAK
jgi:hypothetical protein